MARRCLRFSLVARLSPARLPVPPSGHSFWPTKSTLFLVRSEDSDSGGLDKRRFVHLRLFPTVPIVRCRTHNPRLTSSFPNRSSTLGRRKISPVFRKP